MNETVTIPRAEYEALLTRIEDAEDLAAVALHRAREEMLGKETARADALPADLVAQLLDGANPVRVWRKHRGMTAQALAGAAGINYAYLSEIEGGKKPGSLDAISRIARALRVQIEDLVPWSDMDKAAC